MSPANPADLPRVAAALAGLDGVDVDVDTNSVSVFAPDGVATLVDVFRRVDALGIELADISLRKPSLDEAFLHLTERTVAQSMSALAALTERSLISAARDGEMIFEIVSPIAYLAGFSVALQRPDRHRRGELFAISGARGGRPVDDLCRAGHRGARSA